MTNGKTIALNGWTFACFLICCPVGHSFSYKEQVSFNFMAAVIICSDFGAPQKNKSLTVSIVSSSICHEVMGLDAMILIFWMLSFKQTFSLSSFTLIKTLFSSFFTFCHKGGVICISEVTDISPGNLESSLCFIQPSISHDVLCREVK